MEASNFDMAILDSMRWQGSIALEHDRLKKVKKKFLSVRLVFCLSLTKKSKYFASALLETWSVWYRGQDARVEILYPLPFSNGWRALGSHPPGNQSAWCFLWELPRLQVYTSTWEQLHRNKWEREESSWGGTAAKARRRARSQPAQEYTNPYWSFGGWV